MGAKKKGKANKLARMSEEEKIRYLQHRAAIEEEARRRKEQLISTFMKNKLKREEGFSRLNMAKINQQWRQTLRQMKCVELKQDLEDLFKWFDYTANKKNRMIETLLTDLEEAECQYSRIHQCQIETIDKLIKIHSQRLGHFYEEYKRERDNIREKGKADITDIINSYKADEEHLQTTLHRMEETCSDKLNAMSSKHFVKMDELRNNMLNDLENLQNSRELQIEQIWQNFETVLKEYSEQTEERRRQYIIMKETDYENCKQIFENNQQINALTDTIANLRDQLSKAQALSEDRFMTCQKEKENSRKIFYSFKKKVVDEMEEDKKRLGYMNSVADKTTQELERILSKGEQILQLQSLCRKLETLHEKICPDGSDKPQLTEEEENEVRGKNKERDGEPLAEKAFNNIVKLEGFWKRYNRVFLEKEALALHYQSLLDEQKQLKEALKSYLMDWVNKEPESKVSYANGIQVYRERAKTALPTERKLRISMITCIEATQSPSIRQLINAQMRKPC